MEDYGGAVDSAHPACIVFAADQSKSMGDPGGVDPDDAGAALQSKMSKAEGLADAVNEFISALVRDSFRGDEVKNYYYVGVIGYRSHGWHDPIISNAFRGDLARYPLATSSQLADNVVVVSKQREIMTRTGNQELRSVDYRTWISAESEGGTPMAPALLHARDVVSEWASKHRDSVPPIVINVTDGEANVGGDPTGPAREIANVETDRGRALLFNVHLSSVSARPVLLPGPQGALPDDFARMLYEMSSELPEAWASRARQLWAEEHGLQIESGARLFAFNCPIHMLVALFKSGTPPSRPPRDALPPPSLR